MFELMRARRFAPLFWCQFLSAFNDNFVRQMLALLILFQFGGGDAGAKIQLAVALFVLPSIPPSPAMRPRAGFRRPKPARRAFASTTTRSPRRGGYCANCAPTTING